MERTTLGALALCTLLSGTVMPVGADDGCIIPVPPRMPDAETVSQGRMLDVQQQVHAYLAASEAYFACFRRQEAKWSNRMTPARRQFLDQLWNAQVNRMHRTANHFNVVLAEFRLLRGEVLATNDGAGAGRLPNRGLVDE